MRTVNEYLAKVDEFDRMEESAPDHSLKRRYMDLAKCYRLLADERKRLVAEGVLQSD